MSKAQGEKPEAVDEKPDAGEGKAEAGERADGEEPRRGHPAAPGPGAGGGGGWGGGTGGGGLTIYLFGRTGRDKEEWFRRFLLASGLRWGEGRGGGSLSGACKSGESQWSVVHTVDTVTPKHRQQDRGTIGSWMFHSLVEEGRTRSSGKGRG